MMATSFANITSEDRDSTRVPPISQSVDVEFEVEFLERATRKHQPLARDPIQSSTVQDFLGLRSFTYSDVASDFKKLWKSTGTLKDVPSFASFRVMLTRDVGDALQKALAKQAALMFEERLPVQVLRSETSPASQFSSVPDGSTSSDEYSSLLRRRIVEHLMGTVHIASDEVFVDGMESTLSRDMSMLIETYGDLAVTAIEHILGLYYDHVEIVGEILRQLGQIEDSVTHRSRMTALVAHLESSDPRVRDAASIGLAAIDDPAAIEPIREAIGRESSVQLQRNLQLVLDQLQSTKWQVS